MKKLLLLTVLALTTIGAMAQDKANHNTSRSNKTPGGKVDPNTDTNESEAGIFERRKCVKAGGTFYEYPNGNTKCWPARVNIKSQNLPSEEMEGGISERKKCLKSGGVWATNSVGTFCYKRLTKDISPSNGSGNATNGKQISIKNKLKKFNTKSNTTGNGNTANGYQALSLVKGDNGDTENGNQSIIKNKTDSIKTKANHNTSRSNKTPGGKVDPNTNASLSKTDAERATPVVGQCSLNCIKRPYAEGTTPITYARLSKADAKRAIPAFMKYIGLKGDTDGSEARILERTACVKAGSTFYEFTDGTTICLPVNVSAKSQNLPSVKTGDVKFHPCMRSCSGILVTSSTGTAIYKKVTEVNGKSKK